MKYQVLFSLKNKERYIYECRSAAVVFGALRVKDQFEISVFKIQSDNYS